MNVGRILGKIRRVAAPSWAPTWEKFMTVTIAPSVPKWTYQSQPPYRLVRYDDVDRDVIFDYFEHPMLDMVMERFAQINLPHYGETCLILDDNQQTILGWSLTDERNYTVWWGTMEAFLSLERHHDVGEVATWEAVAKVGARGIHQTWEAESHG